MYNQSFAIVNCDYNVNPNNNCPTSLEGFTLLGETSDRKYFLSNDKATWPAAQAATANIDGAYLVSINDQAENDFLKNADGNNIYFIGLSDADNEGSLIWDSGETLSFDLSNGNTSSNDYGVLFFWDGSWGFESVGVWRNYIVEIPCNGAPTNGPDLTLSNLGGFPASGGQGEVLAYHFDLGNQGNAIAAGDYIIGAYLSTDTNLSNDDVEVGVVNTGNTPVGIIEAVPAAITVPTDLAAGEYYLILNTDDEQVIAESDESNNILAATQSIQITETTNAGNRASAHPIQAPEKRIKVFPNPALDQLNILLQSDKKREATILQFFDSRGRLQLTKAIDLNEGTNEILLDISQLSGGMYFLQFPELQSKRSSANFIKWRD